MKFSYGQRAKVGGLMIAVTGIAMGLFGAVFGTIKALKNHEYVALLAVAVSLWVICVLGIAGVRLLRLSAEQVTDKLATSDEPPEDTPSWSSFKGR